LQTRRSSERNAAQLPSGRRAAARHGRDGAAAYRSRLLGPRHRTHPRHDSRTRLPDRQGRPDRIPRSVVAHPRSGPTTRYELSRSDSTPERYSAEAPAIAPAQRILGRTQTINGWKGEWIRVIHEADVPQGSQQFYVTRVGATVEGVTISISDPENRTGFDIPLGTVEQGMSFQTDVQPIGGTSYRRAAVISLTAPPAGRALRQTRRSRARSSPSSRQARPRRTLRATMTRRRDRYRSVEQSQALAPSGRTASSSADLAHYLFFAFFSFADSCGL